jgi:hypothetical protein
MRKAGRGRRAYVPAGATATIMDRHGTKAGTIRRITLVRCHTVKRMEKTRTIGHAHTFYSGRH